MAPLSTALLELEHALLRRDAASVHITPNGPAPAASASSSNTNNGDPTESVNGATIAGAIVGVVICIGLFALLASWSSARSRRLRAQNAYAGATLRQQPSSKKSLKQEQIDTFALYRYSSAPLTSPSTAKSCDEKRDRGDVDGHGPLVLVLPKLPQSAVLLSPVPEGNTVSQGCNLTRCVSRASNMCSQALGLAYPPRALAPASSALALDVAAAPQCPEGSCYVCLEEFRDEEELRVLPCIAKHEFHKQCIDPWLLNQCTCPTCRFDLSTLFPKTVEDIEKEAAAAALAADGQQGSTTVQQSPWVSSYR